MSEGDFWKTVGAHPSGLDFFFLRPPSSRATLWQKGNEICHETHFTLQFTICITRFLFLCVGSLAKQHKMCWLFPRWERRGVEALDKEAGMLIANTCCCANCLFLLAAVYLPHLFRAKTDSTGPKVDRVVNNTAHNSFLNFI